MRTKLTWGSVALLVLLGVLAGCDTAPDSQAPSTTAAAVLETTLAPATTSAPTTTLAPTTTESTLSLVEQQQQRYEYAHGLANYGILVDLAFPGIDARAWVESSDIIVIGTVVEVSALEQVYPYCAFYLEPTEILHWASPTDGAIPFILWGEEAHMPVRPGEEVLVIANTAQMGPTVTGYVPTGHAWGVFMQVGDEYVSLVDPSVHTTPEALRQILLAAD